MMTLFKADIYRILKSKSFWITQVVLIVMGYFAMTGGSVVVVVPSDSTALDSKPALDTVMAILVHATEKFSSFSYFILPLFVIIVAYDLVKKTYKNTLTIGISRKAFILTKWLEFLVIITIEVFLYYGLIAFIAILTKPLGHLSVTFVGQMFSTILFQVFVLQALYSMVYLILTLTYSTAAVSVLALAWSIIITVLFIVYRWEWLSYISANDILGHAYQLMADKSLLLKIILAQLALMLVGILSSLAVFHRKSL